MAALMLSVPEDTARLLQEIPVEGTREAHSHITVLHLGKDLSISAISRMLPVLYDVTSQQTPFAVSTNLVTNFPAGDDGVPVICKVESPALHVLRDRIDTLFFNLAVDLVPTRDGQH